MRRLVPTASPNPPAPGWPRREGGWHTPGQQAAAIALGLVILLVLGAALFACGRVALGQPTAPGLRVATWNLEHLAERDGEGCRPRAAADYAAMAVYARDLHADVVAFEEVEDEAAAARVFPAADWAIVMEARAGSDLRGACREGSGQTLRRQAVGVAVRRGLTIERHPDVVSLQLGDPDLRSGVDLTVSGPNAPSLRLLAVHLKSGCPGGSRRPETNDACPVRHAQDAPLAAWIAARAAERAPFAVVGDFNRRLAVDGDADWAAMAAAAPGLSFAAGNRRATCDPRHWDFIDGLALGSGAGASDFEERTYAGPPLSDHCAVEATVR